MPRLPVCTSAGYSGAFASGFYIDHSSGSQKFLRRPQRGGLVTVPFHRKDLKRGTLKSIIEQAGLTIEKFVELL